MMATDTRLNVRVTPGYLRELKIFAAMESQTLTELVMAAIEEYTAARDYRIAPKAATERAVKK